MGQGRGELISFSSTEFKAPLLYHARTASILSHHELGVDRFIITVSLFKTDPRDVQIVCQESSIMRMLAKPQARLPHRASHFKQHLHTSEMCMVPCSDCTTLVDTKDLLENWKVSREESSGSLREL